MSNHNQHLPPELERYLAHCRRLYERMEATGEWPWPDWEEEPDSRENHDVVESEDYPDNQNYI